MRERERARKGRNRKSILRGIRAVGNYSLCQQLGSLFITELSGLLHQQITKMKTHCIEHMFYMKNNNNYTVLSQNQKGSTQHKATYKLATALASSVLT